MEFETKVWDVSWKITKVGENNTFIGQESFNTFETALKKAREISGKIDISPCLAAMRNDDGFEYRNKMADFIELLINNCAFFKDRVDIPSLDPKDYNVPTSSFGYKKQDTHIGKDFKIEKPKTREIYFKYFHDAEYNIKTNIEYLDDIREDLKHLVKLKSSLQSTYGVRSYTERSKLNSGFTFNFYCENETALSYGQISKMTISLKNSIQKNKTRHSVKILEVLRQSNKPLRICDIVELTKIHDRKTITRNISKLIDSGFDIRCNENKGYYIPKVEEILTKTDMEIIRQSVELNRSISPEEKERLILLLLKL